MTTIELASSMCPALVELIEADDAPIDRIEIGPWFDVTTIQQWQTQLPGWRFHVHDGDTHNGYGSLKPTIKQMHTYHAVTDSPFVSLHITLTFPGMVRVRKYGLPVPRPSNRVMERRLIKRVEQVKSALGKPVILENMPGFPKFPIEAQPDLITRICDMTDCDMLLDLGHARCGADNLDMDIYDYLSALPLHRVRQIHTHGARLGRWNKLEDAHEPMQAIDYEILSWLLDRTQPNMLTLEYWKDKSAIREQLHRLREMIDNKSNP